MTEHIWGLDIEEYSTRTFEPQISEVSNSETEAFKRLYDVPPLTFVESSLRKYDPRFYGTGDMKMDDVLVTIGKYGMLNDFDDLFKYYYGFLCIRHLLHITCLAALGRSHQAIDTLVAKLPQNACWTDISNTVAAEALDRLAQTTRNAALFDKCCNSLTRVRIDGSVVKSQSLEEMYITLVAASLWKARNSFLMLCQRGLLPGSTLLLVIALRLTPIDSSEQSNLRNSLMLQDLAFRLYLVGSHHDRQILQLACMPAIKAKVIANEHLDYLISSDDSRLISRAYADLLPVWRRDPLEVEGTSIRFISAMNRFILHMLGFNPSRTAQE
ncbi:hypothetical protein FRC09_011550 [Ceratobasidium sp. 395]|nr:hypothetical protein FRC09_011550 [Ceratobasidium sp. 395]